MQFAIKSDKSCENETNLFNFDSLLTFNNSLRNKLRTCMVLCMRIV